MKKLGLLSVAAAVALTSSAFAGELKVGADATIKGYSVTAQQKEANEYYNQEVNLNVMMKNDDGITMKAGWVIYDNKMGAQLQTNHTTDDANATDINPIQPTLDYGYIIAPLSDVLTLKAGYIEAGPFGTQLTNGGTSAFKPFALDYKVAGLSIGLEEHMKVESGSNNKNGGAIMASGEDETSATRIYVKGKAGDLGWGVRTTMTYTGKDSTDATSKDKTDTQNEAYVVGSAAGLGVAFHYAAVDGDSYTATKAQSAIYAHALMPMGNLTTGVAVAMLNDGFKAGAEFDPTIITDVVLDRLPSSYNATTKKSANTSLTVIPVIFKINETLTFDGSFTTGKLTDKSYTEIDAGLTVALGKATNLKVIYATGSGEAVEYTAAEKAADATKADGISIMGWSLSTAF